MDKAEVTNQINPEMEQTAAQRARDRANATKWDINIAIFLFAVLILVILLLTYTRMGIEIVAPIAIFGLSMVWLVGWRRGRELYHRFYDEELARIQRESKKTTEETVEEKVQKALSERLR